jgi:hypothetical protein
VSPSINLIEMKNFVLALLITLSACSGNPENLEAYNEASVANLMELPATKQSAQPDSKAGTNEIRKKLVYKGGIEFESKNIEKDYQKISELLPKYEAYLENEDQSKNDYRINYHLTIRVPVDAYDTVYSKISSYAYKLDNRFSRIEDVTEQYYDLKGRLKNQQELEKRYLQLLNKADDIKDVLAIENKLNEVRTEIEYLQGQFNYLSKQVSYSTIEVNFYEKLPYEDSISGRDSFGERIANALTDGWHIFISFIVGLISLWPFILLIVLVIILTITLRSKFKKKKIEL